MVRLALRVATEHVSESNPECVVLTHQARRREAAE